MTDRQSISAIVTTYNSAAFVARALDSIRAQTVPVDQIIVVDDGSSDDTVRIVRGIEGVEIIQQANAGPGAARNAGLRAATGSLIAFLDADDQWCADKTALQRDYLARHPGTVAVSGGKLWRNDAGSTTRSYPYSARQRSDLRRNLPVTNCVGNPSMTMIRKSALEAVGGFDAGILWGQDWDLWIRLLEVGDIGFVATDVIEYSWHGSNHSHRNPVLRQQSFRRVSMAGTQRLAPVWRRPGLWLSAQGEYLFRRADIARVAGQRAVGSGFAFAALLVWPFRDGAAKLKLLIRILAGERVFDATKRFYAQSKH
ncbi:glycosyltransferase family A protein [Primorskyibacter aestuariivivens]|uniref:glycosyltransferase family 2 protein n=1 Tax=Primorskyibacter aestuariivivens TaxID=1888912 RepID=UPI002300238A|nr:glycosyltransferase family A protein [Primorskyibacter aestuariivivens]MDA7429628.1 glycosyltransferase family A protein [Primorskyibacter aestuariivivens]